MEVVIDLVRTFLSIYLICVLAWVVVSWLPMISQQMAHNSFVTSARGFLDSVVLPYVRLFKFVPPVRIGGAMLDLSALVAIIVLQVVIGLVG